MLEIKNYSVSFQSYDGFFRKKTVTPIEKISLSMKEREIVAVVGASGSGKSLVAHGIMGILPNNSCESGEIYYRGKPLSSVRKKLLETGEISFIPQSVSYLDPLMKVGKQVRELIRQGNPILRQREIFARYDLDPTVEEFFPYQISGGMARRVLLATAVVRNPKLIIADEPTPGLDEALIEETLQQFLELKEEGASILLITHDLNAALKISDRIIFFNQGKNLGVLSRKEIESEEIKNPYARLLFSRMPGRDFVSFPHSKTSELKHCLRVKNLSFQYGKHQIYKHFSAEFYSHEVVGLVAPSGFGKSTLAKLLAGHLKPAGGQILLDEKPITTGGRNPVQLILQHPELALDDFWPLRKSLEESGSHSTHIKEAFGIQKEWESRYPHELSGGEMQRFCIVRALHPKTRFLIADEMTAMLDSFTQSEIWKELLEYTRNNDIGLIVISHDRNLLEKVTDRIIYLSD